MLNVAVHFVVRSTLIVRVIVVIVVVIVVTSRSSAGATSLRLGPS